MTGPALSKVEAALGGSATAAEVLHAHQHLSTMVAPASPATLRLLESERGSGLRSWLGPTRALRQLTVSMLLGLAAFVAFALSPSVDDMSGSVFDSSGINLAINLGFLASAAALGALFDVAFNLQAQTRAFAREASDPIPLGPRLVLGVVAGVVLAEIVVDQDSATITRPVLALLGGYSADVVHRIIDRLLTVVDQMIGGEMRATQETTTPAPTPTPATNLELAADTHAVPSRPFDEPADLQLEHDTNNASSDQVPARD